MGWIRRHVSYTSVTATVALVLAIGGSAYAAANLPPNSVGTTQLKNGAVTTSKLRNRAVTAAKLNPAGVKVPFASQATNAGHAHVADSAPLPKALPHGETLTGTYGLRGEDDATAGVTAASAISFPIPLPRAPVVHVIKSGDPAPSGCSGSAGSPHAATGNLCIFEGFNANSTVPAACTPLGACSSSSSRYGVVLIATGATAGLWYDWGTWAVTG